MSFERGIEYEGDLHAMCFTQADLDTAIATARADQREVDAKVAETMYGEQWDVGYINAGISIAAAIRAMDKPKPEGQV